MGPPQTSDQNPLASKILKVGSHRKHEHSTLEDFSLASPVTAGLNPSKSATSTVVRRHETERIIFGSISWGPWASLTQPASTGLSHFHQALSRDWEMVEMKCSCFLKSFLD